MASVWISNKGGKYLVRWYVDNPKDEKSETFAKLGSSREPGTARYRKRELEGQFAKGTYVDPKLSRASVYSEVEKYKNRATKGGTRETRERLLANLGGLGDLSTGAVRPSDIRTWVDQLRQGRPWANGAPVAATTAVLYLNMLKAVFNTLVDDKVLTENPARRIHVPDQPKKSVVDVDEIPSLCEVRHLVAEAEARQWEQIAIMLLISAQSGLRVSEVAGLRVKDVDFLRRRIQVRQQIGADGKPTTTLKTDTSRRTVPLADESHEKLSAFLATVERGRDDLIFKVHRTGNAWNHRSLAGRFKTLAEAIGMERYTWKSLRHFYASSLIQAGVNVRVVQLMMGHSTAVITLTVYTHLWPDHDDRALTAIRGVWAEAA
ncbi:tyrosine-type recombinase/integrase [Nocardia brasiliensis]|uniref:tyrosine-type recombinase/integrase n=1 Tax=Nocardia brasiliensis TaxID=37326 RepID=UPI002454FDB7|nr:site-specific integrase [Nocardia brasiliensis]